METSSSASSLPSLLCIDQEQLISFLSLSGLFSYKSHHRHHHIPRYKTPPSSSSSSSCFVLDAGILGNPRILPSSFKVHAKDDDDFTRSLVFDQVSWLSESPGGFSVETTIIPRGGRPTFYDSQNRGGPSPREFHPLPISLPSASLARISEMRVCRHDNSRSWKFYARETPSDPLRGDKRLNTAQNKLSHFWFMKFW